MFENWNILVIKGNIMFDRV